MRITIVCPFPSPGRARDPSALISSDELTRDISCSRVLVLAESIRHVETFVYENCDSWARGHPEVRQSFRPMFLYVTRGDELQGLDRQDTVVVFLPGWHRQWQAPEVRMVLVTIAWSYRWFREDWTEVTREGQGLLGIKTCACGDLEMHYLVDPALPVGRKIALQLRRQRSGHPLPIIRMPDANVCGRCRTGFWVSSASDGYLCDDLFYDEAIPRIGTLTPMSDQERMVRQPLFIHSPWWESQWLEEERIIMVSPATEEEDPLPPLPEHEEALKCYKGSCKETFETHHDFVEHIKTHRHDSVERDGRHMAVSNLRPVPEAGEADT